MQIFRCDRNISTVSKAVAACCSKYSARVDCTISLSSTSKETKKHAEKTSVVDLTAIGDHQTSCVGAELETDYDTQQTMETDTKDIRETEFLHKCTQTDRPADTLSICKFLNDSAAIHYHTGLENYDKFQSVLCTLLPTAHYLKYRWRQCTAVISVLRISSF